MGDPVQRRVTEAILAALAEGTYTLKLQDDDWLLVDGDIYLPDIAEAAINALPLNELVEWAYKRGDGRVNDDLKPGAGEELLQEFWSTRA
jgi:hypothetical protein